MRVAYVTADRGVPVFGRKGCSVHVQEIVRAFLEMGHDVDVFTSRVEGDAPSDFENVKVHELPKVPKGTPEVRERAALAANAGLRAMLDAEEPFDAVYERYSLWSFAGMEYASEIGVPGLLEVNAPLIEEQAKHRDLIDRDGAELAARRAFGSAGALLAVSDEVAEYLRGRPGTEGRVHTVPNGVNVRRFDGGITPAAPDEAFTVGFVGTLKPWHGLPVLVEAFALFCEERPDSRLLVVGDGPERETMEDELARLGLSENARFTGAVAPEEIPALLASMDAAVAPYPARDDFYFSPLKVYEYMAASLPVVASRVGQVEDVLRDGENGFLVEPGDPKALASALGVLAGDEALRASVGGAARRTVVENHTWGAVAGRIIEISGLASDTASKASV